MQECPAASLQWNLKQLIFGELKICHLLPEEFSDDEPIFGERLGLDSIDAVEIVYLVEKNFGVAIKDSTVAKSALQSVNTLSAFIEPAPFSELIPEGMRMDLTLDRPLGETSHQTLSGRCPRPWTG